MPVNPSETMFLIAAWPDNLVAPELIIWGMSHKFKHIFWYSQRFVECAYNSAIKNVALTSDCQEFIFADRDVRPGPDAEAFLQAEGPLVVCKYDVKNNHSWDDAQAMHCGLWRCERRVLEAIKPPWFQRVLSDDGTLERTCVCMYFRDKARAAGFSVVRAGWTAHDTHTT